MIEGNQKCFLILPLVRHQSVVYHASQMLYNFQKVSVTRSVVSEILTCSRKRV